MVGAPSTVSSTTCVPEPGCGLPRSKRIQCLVSDAPSPLLPRCIPRPTSLGLHSPPFLVHPNFCKLTLDYGPVVLSALRVLIHLTLTR